MKWPNDAGSTAHGANRRFSRYKNYSNPRYIHTKSEAEDFCKEINEKAKLELAELESQIYEMKKVEK